MPLIHVEWPHARPLTSCVLGWSTPGPVPGDEDSTVTHLAEVDDDGGLVGVVSFLPHPCPNRPGSPAIYLYGMAVRPRYQRRGIGTKVMREVIARSLRSRVAVVWADAREDAVPFYAGLGAEVVGEPYPDSVSGHTDRRVIFDLVP